MLLHSIKQYVINWLLPILFPNATVFYLSYSSLLNKILFNNYNASYAGRMYHVVHLLLFFCFAGTKKTSLLNFVSERIIFLKLVCRINNIRYSFKKNKLPFKLVKTTFYRPHTFKLKSISKYRFLLHWKSFENI